MCHCYDYNEKQESWRLGNSRKIQNMGRVEDINNDNIVTITCLKEYIFLCLYMQTERQVLFRKKKHGNFRFENSRERKVFPLMNILWNCVTPLVENSKAKNQRQWNLNMIFSFLIGPWNFYKLFPQCPCKFHFLNTLVLCFFNSPLNPLNVTNQTKFNHKWFIQAISD